MRVMGLDYGTKTVGVAISDPLGLTAQGIETIQRKEEIKLLCCQSGLKVNFKQCTVGRIRKIAACAEHKRARNTEMSEQHLPEFFINGLALFLFLLDFCRILRRRAGISAFLGISGFICGIFPGKWLAGFCFFTLFGCIYEQRKP